MTKIDLVSDPSLGDPAKYGISELRGTLSRLGSEVTRGEPSQEALAELTVLIGHVGSPVFHHVKSDDIVPPGGTEAYALAVGTTSAGEAICVVGSDDKGVMYGCFELAEQIAYLEEGGDISEQLVPKRESPDIAIRRLYTFLHNADLERDWYYSEEYWDRYFSLLARSRYNEFNLVFGHQTAYLIPIYPHLFDMDEYPDVYVEDLTREEQAANLKMLQFISGMAQERGIRFFIGIWQTKAWDENHFFHPQESKVHGIDDEMLPGFTRRGIAKLLQLCPAIGGVQVRMNPESGLDDQSFFRDVVVGAIKECGREIEIDIRNWGLQPETLERFLQDFPKLRVSFKYFAEHQGMPYQPVQTRFGYSYDSLVRNDRKYDVFWHLWNLGTHRLFLWGDPGYVKSFMSSCHLGDGLGFEVTPPLAQKGFSQFKQIPGSWSIYKEGVDHDYYDWEYERYWFFYELWGRIGYNHDLGDDLWLKKLASRFGEEAAPHIIKAYKESSQVMSYLISHHMDDPNMYIWLELDTGGTIDFFSGITPGEKTLFLNGRDYASNRVKGVLSAKISPFGAASDLEGFADRCEQALSEADGIESLKENKEYLFTRLDMTALSALARYNSKKIQASAHLCLFYETGDYSVLREARRYAEEGLEMWKALIAITEPFYYEKLHFGPSGGHWKDNLPLVEYDLARIEKVGEIFERYGLFTAGFDFGGKLSATGPRFYTRKDPEYDPVEPRFTGISGEDGYSQDTGYGWEGDVNLSVVRRPPVSFTVLRGASYIGRESVRRPIVTYPDVDVPVEYLNADFVASRSPASFRVDLPDGRYLLTFVIGDVSDTPVDHGVMNISIDGTDVVSDLKIAKGEIREVEAEADCKGGRLSIGLRPGEGSEWILNALIIAEMKPHVSHLPVYVALKGEEVTINATVTSRSSLRMVRLFYREEGTSEYRDAAMLQDEHVWSAVIPDADHADVLEYYIQAEDVDGNLTCSPAEGRQKPISLKLAEDFREPRVIEHERVTSHSASKPLALSLSVADGSRPTDVWLHYRHVDQNADFGVIAMEDNGGGEYSAIVPATDFDSNFDEMYYFELVDQFGNGSFYPDAFTNGRYYVIKIAD